MSLPGIMVHAHDRSALAELGPNSAILVPLGYTVQSSIQVSNRHFANEFSESEAKKRHMESLDTLLERSTKLHQHLCPRQVLGVRMGMLAESLLGVELPQTDKRVLAFVETDGCFSDGVAVAANCWVGRRTMRVEDYGKPAVTFVDTVTEEAWRIWPHPLAREVAPRYAPEANNKWEAMLLGYQRMPDAELLLWRPAVLRTPVTEIVSRAGLVAVCERCGEEIINEREVVVDGLTLCRACAGNAYYDYADRD
jgi:formylmethanofuran dehydrogenase subunit E